jgi:glycosyltransferase involved in cell wall biosynthesis
VKRLLYVIDDINYDSGAQKVTIYQMMLLSKKFDISVLCLRKPNDDIINKLSMIRFIGQEIWDITEVFALSFNDVMHSDHSLRRKILRIKYSILIRLKHEYSILEEFINSKMRDKLNQFDTVIVVSESSKLRKYIAELEHPKKIQWIHTDYARWSEFSDWTKKITANDDTLYQKYDVIVTLSENIKLGLIQKLPGLKEKVVVIPNLIPVDEIIQKSLEPLELELDKNVTNIITVGRVDKEKAYDRVIDICKKLKKDGLLFNWYIVGDGPLQKSIQQRIEQECLMNHVIMLGRLENPYPLMKRCDLFALLSEYEGQPVTIQEALILGTPIIATDVGGVSEMLCKEKNSILVKNDLLSIHIKLKEIFVDHTKVKNNEKFTYKDFITLEKLCNVL